MRTFCSISDQTVLIKAFPCLMDFTGGGFDGSGQQPTQEDMRGDGRETEGCQTQDHQRMGQRQEGATRGDHNRGQQQTPTQNQRNLRSCDKEHGYSFKAESSLSKL